MDFTFSDKTIELQRQLSHFMEEYVVPHKSSYHQDISKGIYPLPVFEDLKALAKDEELWNLFLQTLPSNIPGTRMSNLEYTPFA